MRIAYMGNLESPNTRVWVDEMSARGIDPVALSVEQPSWNIEWIPIIMRVPRVRGLGIGRRDVARQVARACAEHDIDLLHVHEANRLAFFARASRFRPRLITCWGSDVLRLESKPAGYRIGVRLALSSADAITVGSAHLFQAAVGAGARPERCVRVGWGVDTQQFRVNAATRIRIRREWGLDDRRVILSVRLHKPLYRIDMILRAFAVARASEPDLALVIAGWGTETAALKQLVRELDVEDDVRFVGRIEPGRWPSMPDIYSGADVFCSIPETDGGPLSVLEAMASELPVVVSDVPVMREWIQHTHNGFIWSDGRPDTLADMLREAHENARGVGQRARSFVAAAHERSAEMDKVADLYESLVARRTLTHA